MDVDYVRSYEALYNQTLRLARIAVASNDTNPVLRDEIRGLCSSGSYGGYRDPASGNNVYGKMYILMLTGMANVEGSLWQALRWIEDDPNAVASPWGIEQVNKLQNLCTMLDFLYIGPTLA
jgi:hypothetical protein